MENHYHTLGLEQQVTASLADIRAAYKTLSLTCHPDKVRASVSTTAAPKSRAEEAQARAQAQARWAMIEQAHEILSDPITRAMFDLDSGFVADTPSEHARIARLKRKEAQVAVATMEETVAQNRADEAKKGGLLIVAARYGDLSASDLDQSDAVSAPYIDVSVPLQCMVHDSALILPEGRSRFWLEGFYDPSMGAAPEANRLYIRYRFLGQLHEAEFADQEAVGIPLEEHCIEGLDAVPEDSADSETEARGRMRSSASSIMAASSASGSTASSSRSAVRARQKARRRALLYTSVALLGVSAFILRRNGVTMLQARERMQEWTTWLGGAIADKIKAWTAPTVGKPAIKSTPAQSTDSTALVVAQ